ncbi:caspase family protein [Streptomyces sp. NPDC052236]|uniref:caspase family protein n=1 Tax=Streptomyces sp. NPDC052236 TaxID=3365686 RepID=UPI0037D93734
MSTAKRFLFAAGTHRYPDEPQLEDLTGVDEDVARVAELFEGMGYTRILPHLVHDPRARDLVRDLEEWLTHPERSEEDVLVLYYAGHGLRHPKLRGHYLMCHDSRIERPTGTCVKSADLAGLLASSPVRHVLLMVDTCYAGAGTAEMAIVTHDLTDLRGEDDEGPWLLAAARAREQAVDHAFVAALEHALKMSRAGMRQPYLDPVELTGRIDTYLREHHPHQSARCSATDVRVPPPFFPNPGYRPGLPPELMDLQAAREWTAHFDPRGRGVEYASEKGDYFTGRLQALAVLAAWLRQPQHDGRARLVTGGPGSGKSAVLGRLLALADPDPARRPGSPDHVRPPAGCVTLAVHARGTTLEALTARLAAGLDVPADTCQGLLAALADRVGTVTVLIDALDEAGTGVSGTEPRRIARELLRPLSALPHVRLLVGTRRGPVANIGSAVELIDLDAPAYTGHDDISQYARRLLADVDEADRLADAVARRARGSFLVARMTARALAHGDLVVDTAVPDWESRLPSEAGQAFDAYLAQYGDHEPKVRRLLAPLAYAEGEGLPWDSLWVPLATALSGVSCTDEDVDWLFHHAGAYVVEVPVDGDRSVFRLFHEALAEHLRNPRRDLENQRRFTHTLLRTVPIGPDGTRDWSRAHPYVLAHLPGHAAAARELDQLVEDADLLVHADPDVLLPALEAVVSPRAKLVRAMYRTSAHLYRRASSHERAQILSVDAARFRAEGHREQLERHLTWRPRWATASQTSTAFRFVLREGSATGVACAVVDGHPIALAGGRRRIEVWDLATGARRDPLDGHSENVVAVVSTVLDGRPIAVSSSDDHSVRVWDLSTGASISRISVGDDVVEAMACTQFEGSETVACYGYSGAVWFLDLRSHELHQISEGDSQRSKRPGEVTDFGIGCVETDGAPLIVTIQPYEGLALWDGRDKTWHQMVASRYAQMCAVDCVMLDGSPIAVTSTADGIVELWDLNSRAITSRFAVRTGDVTALTCTSRGRRQVAVIGYSDGAVEVRELPSGRLLNELNGQTGWVNGIACAATEGVPVVLTSSDESGLRMWEMTETESARGPAGHTSSVHAVACAVVNGNPVAVTGSYDHTVRMWDLTAGTAIACLTGHTNWVKSTGCAIVNGTPVAVSTDYDGQIRVWDLATATQLRTFTVDDHRPVAACTVMNGAPVAMIGGTQRTRDAEGSVPLLDMSTGDALGWLCQHPADITAVACASSGDSVIALTAQRAPSTVQTMHKEDQEHPSSVNTVIIWDLVTRTARGRLHGCTDQVSALACAFIDGHPIGITGTADTGTHVWDLSTGRMAFQLDTGREWVHCVTTGLIDGTQVAVTAVGDSVRVWDLTSARLLQRIELPLAPRAVAIGPNGELVVGAGYEVIVLERTGRPHSARGSYRPYR